MPSTLSAYEQQRERNIAANHAVLKGLGLEPPPPPPPKPAAAVKRKSFQSPRPEPARRVSSRLSTSPATAATSTTSVREKVIVPWETEAFRECEKAATEGSGASFDASRHHQHCTRSDSGRAVATTGVAGYGAALARRVPGRREWAVRAVRFGVGGFGVGVVPASMKPPFKSIGKSPGAIGAYLASGAFASPEHGERPFGPAYEAGDLVEVLLRPSGKSARGGGGGKTDVVYRLNGAEVGVAASVAASADALVLAVQPYMGGVAMLE